MSGREHPWPVVKAEQQDSLRRLAQILTHVVECCCDFGMLVLQFSQGSCVSDMRKNIC